MAKLGIFDPDLRAAALSDEGLVAEGNFDPDFIGPPAGGGASGPTTRPSVISQAFRRARRVFMGAVIVLHAPTIPPPVAAKPVAPVVISQAIPRASSWRRHDRNSSHVVLARTPAAQIYAKAVPPTIVQARRHRGLGSVHFAWNSQNPNPILTTPKPTVVLSRTHRPQRGVIFVRAPQAQAAAPSAIQPLPVVVSQAVQRARVPQYRRSSVTFDWNSQNPNPILTTPDSVLVRVRTYRPRGAVIFVRTAQVPAVVASSTPKPTIVLQGRASVRPKTRVVVQSAPQPPAAAVLPIVVTSQSRARASAPQYRRALVSFDWNSGNANPILAASRAPTVVLSRTHRPRASVIVSRAPQTAAVVSSPAPEAVIVRAASRRPRGGDVISVRAPQATAAVVTAPQPLPTIVRAPARRPRGGSALFVRAPQSPASPAKPVVVLARARVPRHTDVLSLRTSPAQVYVKGTPVVGASQTPIRAARRPRGRVVIARNPQPPPIAAKAPPITVVLQAVRTARFRHTCTPLRVTLEQAPVIAPQPPLPSGHYSAQNPSPAGYTAVSSTHYSDQNPPPGGYSGGGS